MESFAILLDMVKKLVFLLMEVVHSKGGSPGLVVMGGDSWSEGRGFESNNRILDGIFHIYLLQKM